MKKLYFFCALLLCSIVSKAQDYVSIPDINFKAELLANTAINTNADSEISIAEAEAFTGEIRINGNFSTDIKDLTGLEAFINITSLNLYGLSGLPDTDNTCLLYTSPSPRDA